MKTTEKWLPAPGYEGRYEVSNLGRIRSIPRVEESAKGPRKVRGGILNPSPNADGYLHVSLRIDGKLKLVRLHKLIALAFVPGKNPLHRQVAHLDGDRANPRADNLKWASPRENHSHRHAHGTILRGERHPRARLTEAEVREIRANPGKRQVFVERFGVSASAIDDVRRGKNWRSVR